MYSVREMTETTLFSKLPEELLEHVISFNETWAVAVLQRAIKSFIVKKIRCLLVNSNLSCNPLKKLKFRGRKIGGNEAIKTLNLCNCCERHQINKPFSFVKWVDTPISNNKLNCPCDCRHQARMICRIARRQAPKTR